MAGSYYPMKTAKNYKFDNTTLKQIADIEAWLPADSATSVIEQAVADFHNRLKLRRELGDFQAELAELWLQFKEHPNYDTYTTSDGTEVMYNAKQHAKWSNKGVFAFTVLERKDGLYKTAYTTYKLNELANSERWFVP
jgi:hypothetical protein